MSAVGDTNPAAIPDPKDIETSGEEALSASDEIVESKGTDESIPTVRILFLSQQKFRWREHWNWVISKVGFIRPTQHNDFPIRMRELINGISKVKWLIY